MKTFLDSITETCGDKPLYLTDEDRAVELPELRDILDMVVDIMDACRDEMDDFIEMACGNGIYQGHFMLVKFGLEQAMKIIKGVTPSTKGGAA